MNGVKELEFENGEKTELVLNFAALYKIRGSKSDVYKRYNKIILEGPADQFDLVTVAYTAYLCAHVDTLADCMTETEFMEKLRYNPRELTAICNGLISAKKKTDSEETS